MAVVVRDDLSETTRTFITWKQTIIILRVLSIKSYRIQLKMGIHWAGFKILEKFEKDYQSSLVEPILLTEVLWQLARMLQNGELDRGRASQVKGKPPPTNITHDVFGFGFLDVVATSERAKFLMHCYHVILIGMNVETLSIKAHGPVPC